MSQGIKKGFERLKGAAVAGAMGLGMVGGYAGAAVTNSRQTFTGLKNASSASYRFTGVGNNWAGYGTSTPSSQSASAAFGISEASMTYTTSIWTSTSGGSSPSTYTTSFSTTSGSYQRFLWHTASQLLSYSRNYTFNGSSYWSGSWVANSLLGSGTGCSWSTSSSFASAFSTFTGNVLDFNTRSTPSGTSFFTGLSATNALMNCYDVYNVRTGSFSSWITYSGSSGSGTYTNTDIYRSDGFDNVLWAQVDGTFFSSPTSSLDLSGNILTTETTANITPGIDAQIEYYFVPNEAIVRAIYTLTNTTGSDINTALRVGGDLGADEGEGTLIEASSSGDLVAGNDDRWLVAGDSNYSEASYFEASTPFVTISRFGEGAGVEPTNIVQLAYNDGGSGEDVFVHEYNVTVPAGGSASVMVFAEISRDKSTAISGGDKFDSLSTILSYKSGILADGLSENELLQMVNYNAAAEENSLDELDPEDQEIIKALDEQDDDGEFEFFGSMGIPSLIFAMCYGFLGWYRRKI